MNCDIGDSADKRCKPRFKYKADSHCNVRVGEGVRVSCCQGWDYRGVRLDLGLGLGLEFGFR